MQQLGLDSQPAFVAWLSAKGCKVHQATISRLLNLEIKEDSHRVKEVCKHAGIDLRKYVIHSTPHKSPLLMDALAEVWDGTKPHERWLARMIRAAGAAPTVS